MIPHRPYDPSLLDVVEQHIAEWKGLAFRQVFSDTDVLRANILGARWNPPNLEAIYCSLKPETAIAEIDHLISRQPIPIKKPRVTHKLVIELSKVADFRSVSPLESCGITSEMLMSDDLTHSQLVGGAVAWLGCGGMLIPSARVKGTNMVIFMSNLAPSDTVDPVSQEMYIAGDPGSV